VLFYTNTFFVTGGLYLFYVGRYRTILRFKPGEVGYITTQ